MNSFDLEQHFQKFRNNIVGNDFQFELNGEKKKLVYADWTASGRLYQPIENQISNIIGPYLANTHTETNLTGSVMTSAYHEAQKIIKKHVGANENDVIISAGSGMTGALAKFMRIMGYTIPSKLYNLICIEDIEKPIVFISHMEHHSNQLGWEESICDVEILRPCDDNCIDLVYLQELLDKYKNRKSKIASITACSNVTGIQTDYHAVADVMHKNGGLCYVDFACSAPYVQINMHPENESEKLDAIFFSPHKFLGGPGTSGVCIFDGKLYDNKVPDIAGGGTVEWTNPWGGHSYFKNIEAREDGGTPPFLQTIKTAYCVQLKEELGYENVKMREEEIVEKVFDYLEKIDNLYILDDKYRDRLCIISFYIEHLHYNLGVKLLNDKFGIQVRGGCSCAGTYGHFLMQINENVSCEITTMIDGGDYSKKPGWMRLSIHPTTKDSDIDYILSSIKELSEKFSEWKKEYNYDKYTNVFTLKKGEDIEKSIINEWFYSNALHK